MLEGFLITPDLGNIRTVSNITAKFGPGRDMDERIKNLPEDGMFCN